MGCWTRACGSWVRLRIASITQCQACQLARKSDRVDAQDIEALNCLQTGSEHFTPAERAALTYAELFASITDCP